MHSHLLACAAKDVLPGDVKGLHASRSPESPLRSPIPSGVFLNLAIAALHSDGVPRNGIYRILICRPNHRLGNMLLMTPLITELERLYKGAEIDIVAEGSLAADIFATFFSVKNVYGLPRRGFKRPIRFLSLIFRIRKTNYDLIIDPCMGSGFSRALTRVFKGRYKLGYAYPRAQGLTHAVPASKAPAHMAKRPVALVRHGLPPAMQAHAAFPVMDIRLTEAERLCGKALVRELFAEAPQRGSHTIGIFADATGRKRYSPEWWTAFIGSLRERAPHCDIMEIVPMHGRSMLGAQWPSYYSSSIRRMSAVMAAIDLMISADCGVMHLAVASQVPTVGMFSVTDANIYGPLGTRNSPLLTHDISAADAALRIADAFPDVCGAAQAPIKQQRSADATAARTPQHAGLPGDPRFC